MCYVRVSGSNLCRGRYWRVLLVRSILTYMRHISGIKLHAYRQPQCTLWSYSTSLVLPRELTTDSTRKGTLSPLLVFTSVRCLVSNSVLFLQWCQTSHSRRLSCNFQQVLFWPSSRFSAYRTAPRVLCVCVINEIFLFT